MFASAAFTATRFSNSPKLLDHTLRLKVMPRLRFAGQITGCEGYVESAAIGLMAGRFAAAERLGEPLALPPPTTAHGALLGHITGGHIETIDAGPRSFQPMNINFGLFPPLARMPTKGANGERLRGPAKTRRQEAGALRARARRSRSLDGRAVRHCRRVMDATTNISELGALWRTDAVLKRDVFSTIERGWFRGPNGEVPAILRRIDQVPWWSRIIASHFLAREARALVLVGSTNVAPQVLHAGPTTLVRSWIDGVAMHLAKPTGDRAYFRSAKAALRALHRAGVCHNDLAKEQNWLRGSDGRAYLTDFQLATRFAGRGRMFRLGAYEDLRHLLKHKRRYVPEALTATEKRVLARKSWLARLWLVTGKRVYVWVTRGLLNFTDREGGGPRLVNDAPAITARLLLHPAVRRRSGGGIPGPAVGNRAVRICRGPPASASARPAISSPAASARRARRSICRWSRRCRAPPRAQCAARCSRSSP